jgi:hypothetical protein
VRMGMVMRQGRVEGGFGGENGGGKGEKRCFRLTGRWRRWKKSRRRYWDASYSPARRGDLVRAVERGGEVLVVGTDENDSEDFDDLLIRSPAAVSMSTRLLRVLREAESKLEEGDLRFRIFLRFRSSHSNSLLQENLSTRQIDSSDPTPPSHAFPCILCSSPSDFAVSPHQLIISSRLRHTTT